jgi:hypothetical protein
MFRDKMKMAFKDLMEQVGPQGAVQVVHELLQEKKRN